MKIKRIIAAVLLTAAVLSLSSCADTFDNMRATHAIKSEDGTKITLQDEEYILIGDGYLPINYYAGRYDLRENIYVTESDVPVLLASLVGMNATWYKKELLVVRNAAGEQTFYYRADKYDDIAQVVESGDYFDKYYYSGPNRDGDHVKYYLTDEQHKAFEAMLERSVKLDTVSAQSSEINIMGEGRDGFFFEQFSILYGRGNCYVYGFGVFHKLSESDKAILEEIIEDCKTAKP